MSEVFNLVATCIAGIFLGAMFFGGLWWTTRKGVVSSQPVFWFAGSWLCRTGLMLTGLYFVGSGDWRHLLACLFGLIVARLIFLRLSRLLSLPPPAGSHIEGRP